MKKIIPIKILQACLGLVLVSIAAQAWAAGPEEAVRTLEGSISRASKTGASTEKWQGERQEIIREILDLELKEAWTKFQLEKNRRYIASEQKNIAILEQNLAQAEKTRNTLSPFLEVLYLDLENHVKNDLPFLMPERNRRLAIIRACLDDSTARLPDKFGRILKAIQVESDYGYSVEVTQEVAEDPETGAGQVTCFRLGRLGLFRILAGNRGVQKYNKDSKTWKNVTDADTGEIEKAMEIARKKRVAAVVKLPVGNISGKGRGSL